MLESSKKVENTLSEIVKTEEKTDEKKDDVNESKDDVNEILRKQLEENEKSMKAMQQSYEEKLAEAQNQVSKCCLIFLI